MQPSGMDPARRVGIIGNRDRLDILRRSDPVCESSSTVLCSPGSTRIVSPVEKLH